MAGLPVYFEQRLVGVIDVDKSGPGFTYDPGWIGLRGAFPISIRMPLKPERIGSDTFLPGPQTCCRKTSSCGCSDSFSGWHAAM
jgi:HipA N-terminal domain